MLPHAAEPGPRDEFNHLLLQFINGLPASVRDALTFQLCMFFQDEMEYFFMHEVDAASGGIQSQLLDFILIPSTDNSASYTTLEDDFENFYRAVLILSALDYIFARKFPWKMQFTAKVGTAICAYFPDELAQLTIADEEYQAARTKWGELRSELTYRDLQDNENHIIELLS